MDSSRGVFVRSVLFLTKKRTEGKTEEDSTYLTGLNRVQFQALVEVDDSLRPALNKTIVGSLQQC